METPFFSLLLLRMGVGAFFFWAGLLRTEWTLLLIGAAIFFGLWIRVAALFGVLAVIASQLTLGVPVTGLREALPNIPIAIVMVIALAVLLFGRTGEFMGLDGFLKARKFKKRHGQ